VRGQPLFRSRLPHKDLSARGRKAEAIKRILGQRKFRAQAHRDEPGKAFCEEFLYDFSRLRISTWSSLTSKLTAMTILLLPYRSAVQTWPRRFFDCYHCEPRNAEIIEQCPKEERDDLYRSSCRHYRGTTKLKHYLVDINNSPKDGKEHVFLLRAFAGASQRPGAQQNYANGGYFWSSTSIAASGRLCRGPRSLRGLPAPSALQNHSGIISTRAALHLRSV